MNRIYKVIWSKVKHQYVVVSELAHSCTKSTGRTVGRNAAAVLAALMLTTGFCAAPVQAETPTDTASWEIEVNNDRVEKTKHNSFDRLYTPSAPNNIMQLANGDEGQPGEGGDTTPEQPEQQPPQHTIYNEEGFYAYNPNSTYNALTKDGLWVGGDDGKVGFQVNNNGDLFTNGTATFKQGADMGGQNITNVANGEADNDAVNVSQLDDVKDEVAALDNLAVKYNEDKTAVNLGAATLTTSSAVNAGSVVVDGVTVDGGKITGLTAGTEDADAVNVKQMKDADTATLTSATDYADELDKLNVKYNEDKTAVDLGAATLTTTSAVNDGSVVVDGGKVTGLTAGTEDADAVNVKQMKEADTATLTSATAYADELDKLNVKYDEDKTAVDLSSAALTTTGAISGGSGTFTTSVSVGTSGSTIQIGNGKITGLDTDDIADEEDAVNVGFLNKYVNTQKDSAVQYDANTNKTSVTLEGIGGTVINNVKAGDWSATSNAAAPVSQVYSKTGNVEWSGTNFLNNSQDLTKAVGTLDSAIGNNRYTGRGILEVNADHQTYSDVTSAVSTLDQYIGDLTMHSKQAYFSEGDTLTSVTYGLDELSGAIGTLNFNGTSFVKNQGNLTGAVEILDRNLNSALKAVGVFTTTDDEGNVTASTEINWGGKNTFHYISNGTVVDGMSILDNQIYNINTQLGLSATGSIDWGTGVSTRLSGSSNIIDGMTKLDSAITGLENRVDALEQQPGT